MASEFLQERFVVADEPQSAVFTDQPNPAIARNPLSDVDRQVRRNGELRELGEDGDHGLGRQTGRRRVPKRQVRKSICVNMFGTFFEFGEWSEGVSGFL